MKFLCDHPEHQRKKPSSPKKQEPDLNGYRIKFSDLRAQILCLLREIQTSLPKCYDMKWLEDLHTKLSVGYNVLHRSLKENRPDLLEDHFALGSIPYNDPDLYFTRLTIEDAITDLAEILILTWEMVKGDVPHVDLYSSVMQISTIRGTLKYWKLSNPYLFR